MKRSLFVLAVLLLSFGLASANVGFRVEYVGTPFMSGITPGDFTVNFYMTNDANQRNGFSIPLMFYGTGSVTNVTWVNVGVPDPGHPEQAGYMGGAMEILSNFAPGFYAGVRFTALNQITADYDGNLPDTVNHTTATTSVGWPASTPELLVYRWHLNVDGSAWTQDEVAGTFCIDSIHHANPSLDWLWLPVSGPFGGPYCIDMIRPSNQAPVFADCPTTDITMQWSGQVSRDIHLTDAESNPIVAATTDLGTISVTNGTTVHWAYDPDCAAVGSHDVTICATDAFHDCPGANACQFTVTVLNTAPHFTNCPTGEVSVSIAGSASFDLNAADDNAGDVLTFSVTDLCATVDDDGVVTLDGACVAAEGPHDVDVTVTDCAGDVATCTVHFSIVSELKYKILIQKVEGQLQGHYATVDVIKTGGSNDMYGFDFLFAYDASALNAMGAIPGVIFDAAGAYKWEYFTYRFGPFGNCGSACPSGMIRVTALAEKNDGPNHPLEFNIPDGTVLFQLSFLVSNDRTLECQYVPIRFFWMDCGDNTIAYHSSVDYAHPLSILTAVSDSVFAFGGIGGFYNITDMAYGYPTYFGFQGFDACPPEPDKPAAVQFINFYDGGIDIICSEDIDARGDVNLNGIVNEIADAVVFTNYFIYGFSAFTINIEGQMAATDVNADGITLSVADLVYLIRVIVGDALPYAKLAAAGTAQFSLNDGVISTNAQLGAALFVFDGQVNVSAAQGGFEVKSDVVDGNTRALVYSLTAGAVISGNVLNASEMPVSIEAANYNGVAYTVSVVPTTFSLTNYPNPFNPITTIAMTLTAESDYVIEVFNVAGQKVANFGGHHEAGTVTVDWDASNVASGIYFYRGTANGVSATEKMVLLK